MRKNLIIPILLLFLVILPIFITSIYLNIELYGKNEDSDSINELSEENPNIENNNLNHLIVYNTENYDFQFINVTSNAIWKEFTTAKLFDNRNDQ